MKINILGKSKLFIIAVMYNLLMVPSAFSANQEEDGLERPRKIQRLQQRPVSHFSNLPAAIYGSIIKFLPFGGVSKFHSLCRNLRDIEMPSRKYIHDLTLVNVKCRLIKYLDHMTHLQSLDLQTLSDLTDISFTGLRSLPNLQTLMLVNLEHVTDISLTGLESLPNLQTLMLVDLPGITGEIAYNFLAKLVNLKTVMLENLPEVANPDILMEAIRKLGTVECLDISDLGITDDGVQHIIGMDSIRTLTFNYSIIEPEFSNLSDISRMSKLEEFLVRGGDVGFMPTCMMENLRIIQFPYVQHISSTEFKQILRMLPHIQSITILGHNHEHEPITPEDIEASLPHDATLSLNEATAGWDERFDKWLPD